MLKLKGWKFYISLGDSRNFWTAKHKCGLLIEGDDFYENGSSFLQEIKNHIC